MGVITAISAMVVRESRADIALLICIAGGIVILVSTLDALAQTFSFLGGLVSAAGINSDVMKVLFKVVGIGYIADVAAGLAEESGSRALAEKIALGGKAAIFLAAVPVVRLLTEIVAALLP